MTVCAKYFCGSDHSSQVSLCVFCTMIKKCQRIRWKLRSTYVPRLVQGFRLCVSKLLDGGVQCCDRSSDKFIA